MWDVLSGDFDQKIDPKKCVENVLRNVRPGAIALFHDSLKAEKNLRYALPRVLEKLSGEGWKFERLPFKLP